MISATSGTALPAHSPLSIAFCAFWISFALPTYSGSFLESANSASPRGFERYDDVSPEGISSSVVVTGSWISETTLRSIFSGSALIAGQSLMFGPSWISTEGSATPWLSNTRFSYIVLSKKYLGFVKLTSISAADVRKPLFAAVAAIERASMSATELICPFCTLEPSLLGKFLVE